MNPFKIFIVEDDPWYGQLLKYHLSQNPDWEVLLFTTAKDCLENLNHRPDLICMDYGLPDMMGDKLMQKVRSKSGVVKIIVISAQEDVSTALNILKMGATDYIVKDERTKDLLWASVVNITKGDKTVQQSEQAEELLHTFSFEKTIIGGSSPIQKISRLLEKAASNAINISITGETGTGKEVVARAIHDNSVRRKKPFVAVNMAAIPSELMESELFGHEKGAFTGAMNRRIGKFEQAQGGTIFLDEITEADLNLQAKLLRVIQEREVSRVGGNDTIKLDVRIISASHKNLIEQVKNRQFREDLYYRIIGMPIELPPLRDRGRDIVLLANFFIKEYASANNSKALALSRDAVEKLMRYNYPGNVRELKSIIDLACVMSNGVEISADNISFAATQGVEEFKAVEKTMEEYTWDIIAFYLNKYNRDVLLVADKLNIGKSTIYNLLKKHQASVA